ncbi:MAG: nucleotidyltransferase family protein [Candidatus Micrarchaeota archaeon]|nr:nucleotidyltransferase family protein [Candidatus Micrarchaeota archaeon]MDE1833912.1 nucleotidyltransferase family protein [Candidatus Micrarchaeota archaeon]MDE1859886.1 nucleotidyltransferase family protein [Candidatus Micrarchaeota archaeon]
MVSLLYGVYLEAVILCGGYATRLQPITLFVPKPLLPIEGRPILNHILESMDGLRPQRFVLSTNMKFYDQFKYWADGQKNPKQSIELVVEPTTHHGQKFGAIKGIKYTIDNAKINDDVLIIAGDNFYAFDLSKLYEEFKTHKKVTIAVHDIKSVDDARRFGVVEVKGGVVTGFQEKPEKPKSSLISTGIYIFPKSVLRRFDEYIKEGNSPDAPGYFLQWLIGKEEVHAVVYSEKWYDIGTIDTYKEVFDSYIK